MTTSVETDDHGLQSPVEATGDLLLAAVLDSNGDSSE